MPILDDTGKPLFSFAQASRSFNPSRFRSRPTPGAPPPDGSLSITGPLALSTASAPAPTSGPVSISPPPVVDVFTLPGASTFNTPTLPGQAAPRAPQALAARSRARRANPAAGLFPSQAQGARPSVPGRPSPLPPLSPPTAPVRPAAQALGREPRLGFASIQARPPGQPDRLGFGPLGG